MRAWHVVGVILLATVIGGGGTFVLLEVLDLPSSGSVSMESIPVPTVAASAPESSTTAAPAPATAPPPVDAEASSPPTTPRQLELVAAVEDVPVPVIEALGGAAAVKVTAFDTIDGALDGWSGGNVEFADGAAVMGKGVFSRGEPLEAPFAVVGRVSYTEGGWFEFVVEDGTWNTPGFRRWGVYGGAGGIEPNSWEGSSLIAPEGSAPISTEADTWYWVILAVNPDSAMYGVWEEDADGAVVGETMAIDWDVDEWKLVAQVFPDGGLLLVDEYYVLTP